MNIFDPPTQGGIGEDIIRRNGLDGSGDQSRVNSREKPVTKIFKSANNETFGGGCQENRYSDQLPDPVRSRTPARDKEPTDGENQV